MKPRASRITTSDLYYTLQRTEATLASTSDHPTLKVASHPYLVVRISVSTRSATRSAVMTLTFTDIETAKMETFFVLRGYPNYIIGRGRERASTKSRADILKVLQTTTLMIEYLLWPSTLGTWLPITQLYGHSQNPITLTLTQIANVIREGDTHITMVLRMWTPKTGGCPYHCNTRKINSRNFRILRETARPAISSINRH